MSYKVGCKTSSTEPWVYNALRFGTTEEEEMAMVQHTNCIPRDKILFALTDEDMVKFYDDRHDDGAYDALSDLAKVELFRLVKKGLEFGLGEAWSDYLDAAMDEALRYRQID